MEGCWHWGISRLNQADKLLRSTGPWFSQKHGNSVPLKILSFAGFTRDLSTVPVSSTIQLPATTESIICQVSLIHPLPLALCSCGLVSGFSLLHFLYHLWLNSIHADQQKENKPSWLPLKYTGIYHNLRVSEQSNRFI